MPGDKVRFIDNERLDKPDADALQELVYDHISELIGGVLGRVQVLDYWGGLVTRPTLTWTSGFILEIGKCYLYGVDAYDSADPNELSGRVHKYDPSLPIQAGFDSIDLSAYSTSDGAWVFARISDVESDLDNRRKWDVSLGDEVVVSTNTRTRKRVSFHASLSYEPPQSGDIPIFRVDVFQNPLNDTVISPSSDDVIYNSMFDRAKDLDSGGDVPTQTSANDQIKFYNSSGVLQMLWSLRYYLARAKNGASAEAWDSLNVTGISDLNERVTALENANTSGVIGSAYFFYDTSVTNNYYGSSGSNSNLSVTTYTGAGDIQVTITFDAGTSFSGVQVNGTAGFGNARLTTAGSESIVFSVDLLNSSGVATDQDFSITVFGTSGA